MSALLSSGSPADEVADSAGSFALPVSPPAGGGDRFDAVATSAAMPTALALVAAGLSVVISGYDPVSENMKYMLPGMWYALGQYPYPGDVMPESAARLPSLYWYLLGAMANATSLDFGRSVFFLVERLLFFLGLVYTIVGLRLPTMLPLMVVMAWCLTIPREFLAAGNILFDSPSQTNMALALSLVACALLLHQRPIPALAVHLVATLGNLLYGLYGAVMLILIAIYFYRQQRLLLHLIPAGGFLLNLVAASIFLKHPQLPTEVSGGLLQQLLNARSRHHALPFSGSVVLMVGPMIVLVAVVACSVVARVTLRAPRGLTAFAGAAAAVYTSCLLVAQCSLLPGIPTIVSRLQLGRLGDIWVPLMLPLSVALGTLLAAHSERHRRLLLIAAGILGAMAAGIFAAAVVLRGLHPMVVLPRYLPAIFLAAGWALAAQRPSVGWHLRWVLLAAITVPMAAWPLLGRFGADSAGEFLVHPQSPRAASLARMASPAAAHLAPGSVVVVDPFDGDVDHIRLDWKASVYTTWKDGTVYYFDKGFADRWIARLASLGIDVLNPGAYRSLPSAARAELILRHLAMHPNPPGFLLWRTDVPLDLPVLLTGDYYTLYQLDLKGPPSP